MTEAKATLVAIIVMFVVCVLVAPLVYQAGRARGRQKRNVVRDAPELLDTEQSEPLAIASLANIGVIANACDAWVQRMNTPRRAVTMLALETQRLPDGQWMFSVYIPHGKTPDGQRCMTGLAQAMGNGQPEGVLLSALQEASVLIVKKFTDEETEEAPTGEAPASKTNLN
jgi:hypothetical protein